ncbi:cell wall hydrolase [Chenggangzhangella methanolivorans]|uniref:cell wall hydrolase n=1 Tax=Chenggangzhangella methanolivorans TaxID=1437009 RepID=UPI00361AC18F
MSGRPSAASLRALAVMAIASIGLAGCAQKVTVTKVRLSERECLARAMYFESNRSSDAGMLAVGTVVMNRHKSGKYGATVCEVVGAPRQFAPGVLTRPMLDKGAPRARRMADVVLAGKRHPGVQNAQFFHTAGYKFPYNNMRYVLVAGGNAFYDKTKPPKTWYGGEGRWGPPPAPDERVDGVMVAKVDIIHDEPQPEVRTVAAAPRRAEVQVADARPARAEGGAYGGVPTYEPLPGQRSARVRETQVAALERPIPARPVARAQIQEDNGLREEDRWRDQELAEDAGRQPASDVDWRERRDSGVESAPLPVIETRPDPAPRRQTRVASRDDYGYGAPAPQAEAYEPRPAPARRQVSARQQPVAADPAAMGWHAGPQPVRMGEGYDAAPAPQGGSQGEMDGYQPLSRVGEEAMSAPPVRRAPARSAQRSYGGATLEQDRYGYR